ncbi:prolyl oligopeptidase family serine peptidase [Rhodopirellula sp. MGV]|uniref:prolyl oligopeptidase family serine peptidase n=1 Tax=Rhodopirellula sp. MGV TaxID=2023130 RepID=UPI000B96909B|nr:prolyl oligopeptidase family serine peptidase [Rhodopirellula sp. MGV]OYP39185.1 hypothetical protein CGZ80_00635 [Rhodopirellula sp. MGV]
MSLLFRNRCAIAVTIVGCLLFAVRLPNKTLAQSIDAEQPPAAAPKYNLLPPRGIEIDSPSRQALQKRLDELSATLDEAANRSVDAATWRPHVAVLLRAVRLAITQDLFYKTSQVDDANKLLDEANRRIAAATDGKRGLELLGFDPDNDSLAQPLVGGFVSRIDDSFQPFGVVVPAGYNSKPASTPYRLDVWLHGRGDKTTEIPFLSERMTKVGQYAPEDTFVLHPFGRHCNAFKFAGETDVYESIDAMKDLVPVDSQRVSIRGFSMGGAGCWHLAVHDPTHWMAANPGAGFVDTIVYQGWTKATPFEVTPTMQKLFRWYDVLPWVENLNDTRVVAYSGEVDKQKRAADRVVEQARIWDSNFPM